MPTPEAAQRNLARYPWYVAGVSTYAWMPVFFLYFSARLSLHDVLALEAVYYASVVALEVPSGYFSDRVGRRPTLLIAAASLLAAYLTFALAADFWTLAVAQVLLAAGLAFNSGTDTSFHYSSLVMAGQEDTYADREARLGRLSLGVTAAACLAGGALGVLDLRLPYLLSALAALIALVAAFSFTEPPRDDPAEPALSPRRALKACFQHMRRSPIGWVFAVSLVGVMVEHIPYEFIQRYMESLTSDLNAHTATLTTGTHAAVVELIAALLAGWSVSVQRRLGLRTALLGAIALQVALIALMAWTLHPVIAAALLFRAAPSALREAPTRAFLAPRIPRHLQATYLSLQSLAGRLGFAALLLALAFTTAGEGWSGALRTAAWVAGALLIGLTLTIPWRASIRKDN